MNAGKYEIHLLDAGTFSLDGGAMFGIIPRPLWEKKITPDEKNRIKLGANSLLLKSDSRVILFDTGIGSGWDSKFSKIYSLASGTELLFSLLAKHDVQPEDVTDVILTHLHFDHTGGSVIEENGRYIPAFPNARYHIQRKQFEWGMSASEKDGGSYIKERFQPLADEGVITFQEGNTKFDDEIELVIFHGHTHYQQLPIISDGNKTIFFTGDLIPTYAHLHIPYIMAYDLQPLETIREKSVFLQRAFEDEWILIFGHGDEYKIGTVNHGKKGFSLKRAIGSTNDIR